MRVDSRTGKKIHVGRLLDPETGRGIVIACSHGVMHGPTEGLATSSEIARVMPSLSAANGIMVSPGMLPATENVFVGPSAPGLVVHLDWKNFARARYSPSDAGRGEGTLAAMARIEDVADAGAAAVMTYLYVGQKDTALERAEIERNAAVARECERHGIALIIEPRSAMEGFEADATSADVLSFYCRVSAEIGADIVKCIWPGSKEGMAQVTDVCTAPVLLAGGPGGDDVEATVQLAADAIEAGAVGPMFGRRVFASEDPRTTLERLRKVVDTNPSTAGDR